MKVFVFQKLQVEDLSFTNNSVHRFVQDAIIAVKKEYTNLSGLCLVSITETSERDFPYLVVSNRDNRIVARIVRRDI